MSCTANWDRKNQTVKTAIRIAATRKQLLREADFNLTEKILTLKKVLT
jgi:hypothetical protein